MPVTSTGLAPKRVVSACAGAAMTTAVPAVARNATPVWSTDRCSTCCM